MMIQVKNIHLHLSKVPNEYLGQWDIIHNIKILFFLLLLGCFLDCTPKQHIYTYYQTMVAQKEIDLHSDYVAIHVKKNTIKQIKVYAYTNNLYVQSNDSIQVDGKTLFSFGAYRYNKQGYIIQWNNILGTYFRYTYLYDETNLLKYKTYSYNEGISITNTIYFKNKKGDYVRIIEFDNTRPEIREFVENTISYYADSVVYETNQYGYDTLLSDKFYTTIQYNNNQVIAHRYRIRLDNSFPSFLNTTIYQWHHNRLYIYSDVLTRDEHKQYKQYVYTFYHNNNLKSMVAGTDTIQYNLQGEKIIEIEKNKRKLFTYVYDSLGNWTLRTCYENGTIIEIVKRDISYYQYGDEEMKTDDSVSKNIVQIADSLCQMIPNYAVEKQRKITCYQKDIDDGNYGKSITTINGKSLSDFLPTYWEVESSDSQYITSLKKTLIVVAYRTPIFSEEQYGYQRCLALFEVRNNTIYISSQSFSILDVYDKSSSNYNNCNVSFEEDKFHVFYEYSRSYINQFYEYDTHKKDWFLAEEDHTSWWDNSIESNHYNYKQQTLQQKKQDDDIITKDTLIKIKESRKYLQEK